MENIILNEFYFGKQPELLELEHEISIFRKKFRKNRPYSTAELKRDFSDQVSKICELIKKKFGFKSVHFGIELENNNINAYTIPTPVCNKDGSINKKYLTEPVVIVTKKGMNFDPILYPINLIIFLTKGIIVSNSITDKEMISILLHEIGHNFARFVDRKIGDPSEIGSGSYADERFADQFVAMYGYSSELIKALTFINDTYYVRPAQEIDEVPGFDIICMISRILAGLFLDITFSFDSHPYLAQRYEYQIQQLESDLKYTPDLTSKERKEAEAQLDFCKRLMYEYYESKKNPMSVRVSRNFYKNFSKFIPFKYYQIYKADQQVTGDITNSNLKSLYKKTPSKDLQNKKSKKGFFLFQ